MTSRVLHGHRRGRLWAWAADTLALAVAAPGAVSDVILMGGSSLMRLVGEEMQALCPDAKLRRAEAFTAVVDELALAARRGIGVAEKRQRAP